MNTYTFTAHNNNSIFNGTDYSKILDNIILDTLIKNNSYLFTDSKKKADDDLIDAMFDDISSTYTFTKPLKDDNKFIKACNFLANYGKNKSAFTIPYKLNKLYRLADGTPIIFYDDEIQIGFDVFKYSDFGSIDFINAISPKTKKTTIDIYTNNNDLTININL